MPELAFLDAVASFLSGAGLTPAPTQIGVLEPTGDNGELPAIVLALEDLSRLDGGVGGGAEPMTGVLPVRSTVDLANPVLPGDPSFPLISADRRSLILPHGGLVRSDGTEAPLTAADIVIRVANTARTLVAANPGPDQYTVDPLVGELRFGAPLPPTGMLEADYHLGHWERTVASIAGTLVLTVRAAQGADVSVLSNAALRALLDAPATGALPGLKKIRLRAVGPVDPATPEPAGHRGRAARLAFMFDHVVDAAASSGGVIHEIPITSVLESLRLDPASGVVIDERETEPARRRGG